MIRLDLLPHQARTVRNGAGHITLTQEQALRIRGQVTAAYGSGRPMSPDRCPCGLMTSRRAELRGHKCSAT